MTNKMKLLNLLKDATEDEIKLACKVFDYCLKHPEVYDMSQEEIKEVLRNIA